MSKVIFITIFISCLLLSLLLSGLRINMTPSLPLGVYRTVHTHVQHGTMAFFCLESAPFISVSQDRGYLGWGTCPGGLRPLGKVVYGLPGDVVRIAPDGRISVNGQVLPASAARARDRQGRSMPASLLHSGVIPAGKALMLSLYHPGSFDSRYYGLVSLADLRPVQPVFTWKF